MKVFLDTANLELIKKWVSIGIVDGVTTNPTLLSKENGNPKDILLEICNIVPGDVSIEVVKKDPQEVYNQAKEISGLAKNVVVKIPFAEECLPVIQKLTEEGVRINVTLIFSMLQAFISAKLGAAYISPFIGRLDDIDSKGLDVLEDIVEMIDDHDFESEIIVASVRHLTHFHEAVLSGAHVITTPPKLLEQIMFHPLTEKGIKKFDDDWKKLGREKLL